MDENILTHAQEALYYSFLGDALFLLNRTEEAQDAYWQALAVDEAYAPPLCSLAFLYQIQGQTDDALTMYAEYLRREPDDGEAYHNLGLLYASQAMDDEAAMAFQSAAALLSPDDPETATNLGIGCFYEGDLDMAAAFYEHALALDETFLPAYYHLGVTYLYQGRCPEAVAALQAVLSAVPDYPDAAINLGVAYNTAGQTAQSIALFESILAQTPDHPSAMLNLGYACLEAGDQNRAVACFQWCIVECSPESIYAQKAIETLENNCVRGKDRFNSKREKG